MTRWTARTRWTFCLQVLLFVLIAANLEVFSQRRLRLEGYETATPIATYDAHRGYRLAPAPNFANSDGIRNPEVTSPRPPSEFRILCLGGSVVFGSGLEEADTFERKMERTLQASAPSGMKVNVINGGTPGFATHNFAALLFDVGERYQPNVVIVVAGFNEPHVAAVDPRDVRGTGGDGGWKGRAVDRLRTLFHHSATYRYLTWRLLDTRRAAPSQDTDWINRSANNAGIIADYVTAHGARFLLVFEGRREPRWMDACPDEEVRRDHDVASASALEAAYMKVAAERPGTGYLDMNAVLMNAGLPQDVLFQPNDPVHPTATGAGVMADALVGELRARGWTP